LNVARLGYRADYPQKAQKSDFICNERVYRALSAIFADFWGKNRIMAI
tara:strand:- start:183 stop:326 length:144 start_codon:yes stop_codon:yes gene_type:complete